MLGDRIGVSVHRTENLLFHGDHLQSRAWVIIPNDDYLRYIQDSHFLQWPHPTRTSRLNGRWVLSWSSKNNPGATLPLRLFLPVYKIIDHARSEQACYEATGLQP